MKMQLGINNEKNKGVKICPLHFLLLEVGLYKNN